MAPMIFPAASEIADLVAGDGAMRVLDIAAGHGLFGILIVEHFINTYGKAHHYVLPNIEYVLWAILFGILIAQQNSKARITALDWPNVLAVATANAQKLGVADRHSLLPGSAFETEFGGPYDLVLVTNFFHHFDPPTCEKLMRKIRASLTSTGRCVTLDFVPNDDRVSPPMAAGFAMMMLGTTAAGDAYTFAEYKTMFLNAGYKSSELHSLNRAPQTVIISQA